MPPLSDQKIDQDAQRSPKPRKFSFCLIAPARPLCVPWITKIAVVAQQVVHRRGRTIAKVAQRLPWSPNGGTLVAKVMAQWTLLVSQMRQNGDTREAEASLKLIHNVYNSMHCFTGWPMTDLCASILRPRRCVCLPPASFVRPVSDRLPRWPLCDCFENAQNFTVTMGEVGTCSVPPLNDQGNLSASSVRRRECSVTSAKSWTSGWSVTLVTDLRLSTMDIRLVMYFAVIHLLRTTVMHPTHVANG